jgi:cysteine-S-conjugate beta-lyase
VPETYDFRTVIPRRGTDSAKWGRFDADVLPLWVADMDFRSPESLVRALHERVDEGVFGYGRHPESLCEAIVESLERAYGWKVPCEAVVPLPGVAIGFNLACRAFGEPGDGALIQTPMYPPILDAPGHAGMLRHETELGRGPDGRYSIDFDAFESAIQDRTRLFLMCSPHNPVGRVFTRSELERMAEICLRHDVLICSDEIHSGLVFGGFKHTPIAMLSPEIQDRTVTLLAPSKTYNVPGLKCSAAVIPNKALRDRFNKARAGLVGSVNVLACAAVAVVYREGQEWLSQLLRVLEDNRDYLLESVRTRLPGVTMTPPEATYLAWLDCREAGIPGNPYEFFLGQARVGLNDGATFGRGGEGFVRLNFGCPRSTLEEAVDRMAKALAELKPAEGRAL